MASSGKANDPWKALRDNPVTKSLTSKGKHTVPLSGYLLRSPNGGFWRLYRTLAFGEYIEFGEDDNILFVYQVDASHQKAGDPDALEPAIVWFSEDARVDRVQNFLVGDLASLYLPQADLATRLGEAGQLGRVLGASEGGGCSTRPNCGCGS